MHGVPNNEYGLHCPLMVVSPVPLEDARCATSKEARYAKCTVMLVTCTLKRSHADQICWVCGPQCGRPTDDQVYPKLLFVNITVFRGCDLFDSAYKHFKYFFPPIIKKKEQRTQTYCKTYMYIVHGQEVMNT